MTVSGTTSTTTTNPFSQSSTSSSGAPISFSGVISGLNTTSIINALMTAYKQPQTDISNQINQINSNITDYQTIQNDLTSLQTAADSINQTYLWDQTSVASSNSSVATATAAPGTPTGTVSFTVNQLLGMQSQGSPRLGLKEVERKRRLCLSKRPEYST